MPPAVTEIPSPLSQDPAYPLGLAFPGDGSGLPFDAGYPLTFPPDLPVPDDLHRLFPSFIPQPERAIYEAVQDACSTRTLFPDDGGLPLPAAFNIPADISLFAGMDSTYPAQAGHPVQTIPVTRGWPAYPGKIPAIGVAEVTTSEDQSEKAGQAGFAGDAYAYDTLGNVLATCAYYAEPLTTTVVVELIHTNRDERDRLHDQLRRVIYPLRHRLPSSSSQIREVHVDSEKQDLPIDEQPVVMYVSLYTVQVTVEALIATEIVPGGVITELVTSVTPTVLPYAQTASTDLT